MPVSTEDYVAVSDHIGRYCWTVDAGQADQWVALWTEDGTFTGIGPEPVVGREALKSIPANAFKDYKGAMFHQGGNIHCDYGADRDTIIAKLYNVVSTWIPGEGGKFFVMARCQMTLVRNGSGWLLKRNDAELFTGA